MATYAIGDIQGCYDELMRLLDRCGFDPSVDRLWFAGDLVNRGPRSLETLRFVRGLGERAVAVLGNHDLHLLAVWRHPQRHTRLNDTLQPLLDAPDRDDLLEWLRHRPLLHWDAGLERVMVHAGLSPAWDLALARRCAREIEETLQGPMFVDFLEHMYGNRPHHWSDHLGGWERLRYAVNCFTRLRYCAPDGALDFHQKGRPGTQEPPYVPWFEVSGRRSADVKVVIGHWSTLGLYRGNNVLALDTGCLWGGPLSAVRLEDGTLFQVPCPQARTPHLT